MAGGEGGEGGPQVCVTLCERVGEGAVRCGPAGKWPDTSVGCA